GRERRAYLLTEQRRIRHLDPDPEDADAGCHRLHPPRRARRPQVRGRPARGPASLPGARRRILQDPRQGAGGDRRGPGRAQQARVSYIRTPAELADAVATLRREPLVAADTEAASFHRYRDRIYLVQLSSPTLTAIIDPLAAADTQHLPALREALRSRLAALQRLTWAEEEFTRLEDLRWTGTSDGGSPDAFLRVKGAKVLPPRQLAALRELYRWRETVAAEQDRATFRIIGNDALLAV